MTFRTLRPSGAHLADGGGAEELLEQAVGDDALADEVGDAEAAVIRFDVVGLGDEVVSQEQVVRFGDGHRTVVVETLGKAAAHGKEQVDLVILLDALGEDVDLEDVDEADDERQDVGATLDVALVQT